jgi:hypothetical protein
VATTLILVLAIGGGALLFSGGQPAQPVQAEKVSSRLDQMAAAARGPLWQVADEPDQPADQTLATTPYEAIERHPTLVAEQATIEVETGQRTTLAVHIDNVDALEPETSVLIRDVPAEARLSEGITIGPGVWMMRAGLLGAVELDVGAAPSRDYALRIELRKPEGGLVSIARVVLAVAPPSKEREIELAPVAVSEPVEPKPKPTTKPAHERARRAPTSRTVEQQKPASRRVGKQVEHKPAKRSKPKGQVTVLAAPPALAQSGQPPKLVWPGDDPRSAYSPNPPLFLGGAIPDSSPSLQEAPARGESDWHKRVFEGSRGR